MTADARGHDGQPPVVLHVGAHKTGTSLIQRFLSGNAPWCRKHGVDVISRSDCNELIGWGAKAADHPELLADRLAEESQRRPHDRIVISHENSIGKPFVEENTGLYPQALDRARALRDAMADYDVRVVFYVRSIPDFAESYYIQTVQQGASHSFEEWAENFDLEGSMWRSVIRSLDLVFGRENVVIADFAEIRDGQTAFIQQFLRRCGIAGVDGISYEQQHNVSISARGLDIALDVNPLMKPGEFNPLKKFLQANFSNQHFPRARPMPDSYRERLAAIDEPPVATRIDEDLARLSGVPA